MSCNCANCNGNDVQHVTRNELDTIDESYDLVIKARHYIDMGEYEKADVLLGEVESLLQGYGS